MRKFKRNVARYNMKRAGYEKLCRKGQGGDSLFSKLWREHVTVDAGFYARHTAKRKHAAQTA